MKSETLFDKRRKRSFLSLPVKLNLDFLSICIFSAILLWKSMRHRHEKCLFNQLSRTKKNNFLLLSIQPMALYSRSLSPISIISLFFSVLIKTENFSRFFTRRRPLWNKKNSHHHPLTFHE